MAALALVLVTAVRYRFWCRTWKKDVEPSVMMGERTSGFQMTWILKMSAMERLYKRGLVMNTCCYDG